MRAELVRGIRPVDVVLAGVLSGLGILLMLENIVDDDPAIRVDSHSWLLVPVFLAATLPVLWWRRGPVPVLVVACVAMGLHVVAFGALVRCGAGLPLAFAVAFRSGTIEDRRRRTTALGLSVLLCALVLVRDTAAGIGMLPVCVLLSTGLFGIGRVLAHRSRMTVELQQHNLALQRLRDERAALEVEDDRLRLSARLEGLLEVRLEQLAAAASGGLAHDGPGARDVLCGLEHDSRRTLDDMREIVGLLRGGEVTLAPAPSVAHLDGLLARDLPAGSRLDVSGDPRLLPPSVELSAYRIVEHLLSAFSRTADRPVHVTLGFEPGALAIEVTGPAGRGPKVRAATDRARERARLHGGSLAVRTGRGHARVVAQLPLATPVEV